jgi:hypothetical protein
MNFVSRPVFSSCSSPAIHAAARSVNQIEQAAHLAAKRVDVEDDTAHGRVGHGLGERIANLAV